MKNVTCEAGVKALVDYLEGRLPHPVVLELEAHVAGCTLCRAFIESYRETPRILRQATDAAPSPDQRRRLLEYLRSRYRQGQ
jgi:predicted anti-sigma-YlaC factor YlaD